MKKFSFLFLIFCSALSARANDTSGYVLPAGGVAFQKQDGIKMQTEALYIRPGRIEVNYLFENTTDKDITTRLFFPLPPISAVSDYYGDTRDAKHQFDFKLWVNGNPRPRQTHFSLTHAQREVPSVALQLWRTPEESLDETTFHERVSALPEKDRQTLAEGKYLQWGGLFVHNKKTNEWEEGQGWTITMQDSIWKKHISYSWEQTFPARQTIAVRHTYVPSHKNTNTGRPFSKCIDPESQTYTAFVSLPENERNHPWKERLEAANYLEYILTTANNWQGPIENFNLLVESPLKSAGCFDGKAFYAGQYYAVNRRHYTPREDMSVDFMAKDDIPSKYSPKSEPELFRIDGPANVRNKPGGAVTGRLADKTYVWVWPGEKEGKWYPVLQNDVSGYTHAQNLIPVF